MIYPDKIASRLAALSNNRTSIDSDAIGTAANFSCGCFVRFSLLIDVGNHLVMDARFSSNGCGFMLAAADVVAEGVITKQLSDLHGLTDAELNDGMEKKLGKFPAERRECAQACGEALRAAFLDFRAKRIEEFQGEKALICTCFGVSQETIETLLSEPGAVATGFFTVDDITRLTNAGGGCGSCRMLIQEMLDSSECRL